MTSPRDLIGASARRKEDRRLLTGTGRHVDDLERPGLLHMAVVRSRHAHARIVKLAVAAAKALPGVAAVWTASDLPENRRSMPPGYGGSYKGRAFQVPGLARERVKTASGTPAEVIDRQLSLAANAGGLVWSS